jgi:hypothetical protein
MTDNLLIVVPTRSRPAAVGRVVAAWQETGAFDDGAELLFVIDRDDPENDAYAEALASSYGPGINFRSVPHWQPLVPKLNAAAQHRVEYWDHFALGFAGDDHLPRTRGWVKRYLDELRRLGTGIVYCDDGYQHDRIPTQWAMTADIVRTLGRMVPAPVEHLYCDNAIRDLGELAECLAYLPDVLIEHMHPVAGKAATDEQYERVNGRQQFRTDRTAYREWRALQAFTDAQKIRDLRQKGRS